MMVSNMKRVDRIKYMMEKMFEIPHSKMKIVKDYNGKYFLYLGSRSKHQLWYNLLEQLEEKLGEDGLEQLVKKYNGHLCYANIAPVFDTEDDLVEFLEEALLLIALK